MLACDGGAVLDWRPLAWGPRELSMSIRHKWNKLITLASGTDPIDERLRVVRGDDVQWPPFAAKSGEYVTQVAAIKPLGFVHTDPANDTRAGI